METYSSLNRLLRSSENFTFRTKGNLVQGVGQMQVGNDVGIHLFRVFRICISRPHKPQHGHNLKSAPFVNQAGFHHKFRRIHHLVSFDRNHGPVGIDIVVILENRPARVNENGQQLGQIEIGPHIDAVTGGIGIILLVTEIDARVIDIGEKVLALIKENRGGQIEPAGIPADTEVDGVRLLHLVSVKEIIQCDSGINEPLPVVVIEINHGHVTVGTNEVLSIAGIDLNAVRKPVSGADGGEPDIVDPFFPVQIRGPDQFIGCRVRDISFACAFIIPEIFEPSLPVKPADFAGDLEVRAVDIGCAGRSIIPVAPILES